MAKKILITGGAGYIGSHTSVQLLLAGYDIVVVDDFSNSCDEAIKRITELSVKDFTFIKMDVSIPGNIDKVFQEHQIYAVIHFAAFKAVGDSCSKPLEYFRNNLSSTLNLMLAMEKYNVKRIVFSSSATVYGFPERIPVTEEDPLGETTNPYGRTKAMCEMILSDVCKFTKGWSVVLLRYFNPIGSHPSGRIGEDPNGIPNNLTPYILQVAVGKLKEVGVFGNDYDTIDGTGVRDYIHVVDLADGHLAALKYIESKNVSDEDNSLKEIFNLGTGKGTSVLEAIAAFEKASGKKIPYKIVARRPGDVEAVYANATKAKNILGWTCKYTIDDAAVHGWKWQSQNPNGYN